MGGSFQGRVYSLPAREWGLEIGINATDQCVWQKGGTRDVGAERAKTGWYYQYDIEYRLLHLILFLPLPPQLKSSS